MQLKQFYNIATKVSSRKSATTFGDLPDWLCLVELVCFRWLVVMFFRVNVRKLFIFIDAVFSTKPCITGNPDILA